MYWSYSFYAFGLKSLPVNFTAVKLKLRSVGPGTHQAQIINIYGLNNQSGDKNLILTDMVGQTENIKSASILRKIYPKLNAQDATEPIKVELKIIDTKSGLFQGLMLITQTTNNSLSSIPVTIASDMATNYALFWILGGVFSSLIFWECIKIKRKTSTDSRLYQVKEDSRTIIKQTVSNLTSQDINDFVANIEPFVANIVERMNLERVKEYLDNRYSRNGGPKTAFLDILSVLFGMVVGFIGLFNNDYLIGLHVITLTDILILIGMGLGIGSIKELVDKP